ncbi:hypothetical protein [Streptomyces sp. UNOB3_S3]|uniref:hypothetical protein n=1 Tax=Streptomyces sp. UNOB3_S3 TaxID=2871682 RepID=UPI001E49594A|nr:hypothetical protein [Streptomyces sp. UNOB3_S3]MCC3775352.1 hypothetical protein [Streptomyces sp. UNOB3_S3]
MSTSDASRRRLTALQRDHGELLAAARAAVVAHWDGDEQPLSVLIDTLDELGELPEFAPQLTTLALDALAADGNARVVGRRLA